MLGVLTSLLFASAFVIAMTVIIAMFQSHWDKMMAALCMQPLRRPAAPWRMPPRRPARSGSPRIVRQPRLSRVAA